MGSTKVAIVTGGNKGIGFGIVRGLCKQFNGDVILTARDTSRGQTAVSELEAEGLKPKFHQLDIDDQTSIDRLAQFIKEKYGGLDILVNNAAIAYKQASTAPMSEQARESIKTNFWSLVAVSKALFPLLRPGARVTHLSSMASRFAFKKCSPQLQQKLSACTNVEEVGSYMDKFVEDCQTGNVAEWAQSCYGMSKVGVSLITPIHQKMVESTPDVVVNCCCPGYVNTDMTSHKGHKTIDQGADTPLYLSLLPPGTDTRGQYLTERKIEQWKQ